MLFLQKFREVYAAANAALFLRVGPQTDIIWDWFTQITCPDYSQTVVRTISVENHLINTNFFVLSKFPEASR
jgi:hypothetical protein